MNIFLRYTYRLFSLFFLLVQLETQQLRNNSYFSRRFAPTRHRLSPETNFDVYDRHVLPTIIAQFEHVPDIKNVEHRENILHSQ